MLSQIVDGLTAGDASDLEDVSCFCRLPARSLAPSPVSR